MQRNKNKIQRVTAFDVVNAVIMCIVVLLSLYPLYYAVINSFNDGTNTTNFGMVLLWPRQFSMESWQTVLHDSAVIRALEITVSRTVIVTISQTLITSMFAYAFSRSYLYGKKVYAFLGFLSMYISGGIVASFLLLSRLGLYNNYWVYIIPSLFGGFYNVIIFSSNFRSIPDELIESAKLDGASEYRIYFTIVLPLSKAVLAALGVFTIVGVWNDYTTSLYYTSGDQLQTLQYYIVKLVRNEAALEQIAKDASSVSPEVFELLYRNKGGVSSRTLELAAMVIAAIPMILIYPFAQKFFTQGMLVGSIKG